MKHTARSSHYAPKCESPETGGCDPSLPWHKSARPARGPVGWCMSALTSLTLCCCSSVRFCAFCLQINFEVQQVQDSLDGRAQLSPIDESQKQHAAHRCIVEEDVGRHAHAGHKAHILVHGADPQARGYARRRQGNLAVVHEQPPCVRHNDAGQDLDQRTLACPIHAQERVHFTAPQRERHALERVDPCKALVDVLGVERRLYRC